MRYKHIILLASGCTPHRLLNRDGAKELLKSLSPTTGILERNLLQRPNGQVGYVVSEHEHLILTTNPASGQAFLELRSQRSYDTNKLMDALQVFASIPYTKIVFREFTDNDYEDVECQEPRCSKRATKDHNGLKLCQDHYETWQEKQSEIERDREFS